MTYTRHFVRTSLMEFEVALGTIESIEEQPSTTLTEG